MAPLEQDARDGDLFVCHLFVKRRRLSTQTTTSLSFNPPSSFDPAIKAKSTEPENSGCISSASATKNNPADQASALVHSHYPDRPKCRTARTGLRSATARGANPSVLARNMLCNRRLRHDDTVVRKSLRQFLENDVPENRMLEHADRNTFMLQFVATSNEVASNAPTGREKQGELSSIAPIRRPM